MALASQAPLVLKLALPVPLRRLFDYKPLPGSLPAPGCRCLVPFGKRQLTGIVVTSGTPAGGYDTARLQNVLEVLDDQPLLPDVLLQLCQRAARYYHQPVGEMFTTALPRALYKGKSPDSVRETLWYLTERGRHVTADQFRQAHRQQDAWQQLLDHPQGLSTSTLLALGVSRQALNGLIKKGWADTRLASPEPEGRTLLGELPLEPNPEQLAAINTITAATGFSGFLLDGVTGSGKTEVYLQVAEKVLDAGKQILVLVPEIGLTPQTLYRFRKRFNRRVECLHSGMTDKQRLGVWQDTRQGHVHVLLGTRSALFVPLKNPGLIIVDESHDSSLKQQEGCRYHARDLALWRGKLEKIPVVLGSATPSLESLQLCHQKRLEHLLLQKRAGSATPPDIELLDCQTLAATELLHPTSVKAIRHTLERNQQVLLFLNRRGYAPLINCLNCGWQAECPHCSCFMTWHKQFSRLVCHQCDNQSRPPRLCPSCGSSQLGDIGAGTEKLEDYLHNRFPDYPVIRVDRDVTRRKGSMEKQLARIHSGEAALLAGTQMLAKGHHFSSLALTVLLDADAGFMSADFRGAEHAGATILQVAGRTGRSHQKGHVLIQTRHPDLPALQILKQGNWHQLAEQLMEERAQTSLPPFGHAALLSAEAGKPSTAQQFLQIAAQQLVSNPAVTQLGPVPAPLEKRAGRYRFQLLLLAQKRQPLQQLLGHLIPALEALPQSRYCRWGIDVDPQDML